MSAERMASIEAIQASHREELKNHREEIKELRQAVGSINQAITRITAVLEAQVEIKKDLTEINKKIGAMHDHEKRIAELEHGRKKIGWAIILSFLSAVSSLVYAKFGG